MIEPNFRVKRRGGSKSIRPVPLIFALALALGAGEEALTPPAAAGGAARGSCGALLDSILGPELSAAQVALLVVAADGSDTLFAHRIAHRQIPGSNAKLFSTGTLLATRGATARRTTTIEARGEVKRTRRDGRPEVELRGELTLRPTGMPDIVPLMRPGSRGLLDSLAFLLRARGLRRFDGTLTIDRSLFAPEPLPAGWSHDDLGYSYGAPLNPTLANGNSVLLVATEERGKIQIRKEPPEIPLAYRVGRVVVGDSGSAGWLTPRWEFGSRVLEISGVVPRGGTVKRSVAMSDPDSAAAVYLLAAMRREGIGVKKAAFAFVPPGPGNGAGAGAAGTPGAGADDGWGKTVEAASWDDVSADRATVVAALPSPTVGEAIGVVNAQSLNVEAEGILRLDGSAASGKTRREGVAEIYRTAALAGIDTLDLSILDGSGLSPQNLVTARALVRWLAWFESSPSTRGVLRGGMAAPGSPGTLERRFLDLPMGADLRAKTGTLTNVSSIAGYLRTVEGEELIFAMIVNGARRSVSTAREAEDRLVRFLARAPRQRGAPFLRPSWIPR